MSQTGSSLKIVTANRLRDGIVVFLGGMDKADRRWVERVDQARLVEDAALEAALAAARDDERARRVVDPYAVEVTIRDGVPVPVRLRERLRAQGPSVRTDLGKQAESAVPHSLPSGVLAEV